MEALQKSLPRILRQCEARCKSLRMHPECRVFDSNFAKFKQNLQGDPEACLQFPQVSFQASPGVEEAKGRLVLSERNQSWDRFIVNRFKATRRRGSLGFSPLAESMSFFCERTFCPASVQFFSQTREADRAPGSLPRVNSCRSHRRRGFPPRLRRKRRKKVPYSCRHWGKIVVQKRCAEKRHVKSEIGARFLPATLDATRLRKKKRSNGKKNKSLLANEGRK